MLLYLLIGDFFLIKYCLEGVSLYYLNKSIRNWIDTNKTLKKYFNLNIFLILKKWIFDRKIIISDRIFNDICCYHLHRLPKNYIFKLKEHILLTHYPISEKVNLYGKKGATVYYYTEHDLYSFGTLPKCFRILFMREFFDCKMDREYINLYSQPYLKKCYIIYQLNQFHRKLIIEMYFKKKYEMLLKYLILYWFRLKKKKKKINKCLLCLFLMIFNNCSYSQSELIDIRESIGYILSNINNFRVSFIAQIQSYIYRNDIQIGFEPHEYLTVIS